jgi:hypothetical protein
MLLHQSLIQEAWKKAEAKCQCSELSHNHYNINCNKPLVWANRGKADLRGSWEIHCNTAYGPGKEFNCVILCYECYRLKKIQRGR